METNNEARNPYAAMTTRELLYTAAAAVRGGEAGVASRCALLLCCAPADVLDADVEALVLALVDALWASGWQPSEVQRRGRLGCANAAGARLVNQAIAADHAARTSGTLHHRWVAQIESLDLPRVDGRPGWVRRWIVDEGCERAEVVAAMIDVAATLSYLPRLAPILPPPGSADRPVDAVGAWEALAGETNPALERIRNLLAKAESTTFEPEAMAFTAKAQELMTRYAVDEAMVQGSGHPRDRPVSIRLPIDPPYVDAKSRLLHTVAAAARCKSVFHPMVSLATVVGFPADIAAVELLFTSLLVQAQTAMTDAAARAPSGSRPRSRSFRSSFLAGYTHRIGARLREINDAVYAEVESQQGGAFLPVLRSRSAAVDELVSDLFGELTYQRRRADYDAAGWTSGTVAADNAHLSSGEFAGL
ncbi:MAG TPA: DUF2786 domain-containing protein [Acidimicrobiales bacterium]|nr:DUF2786 domain-containing protein [Acidimicrobiales bacterium]